MANEMQAPAQSGKTLYALVRNGAAQVWNPTLNTGAGAFEAFTAGNYASYALALTEQGTTGYYAGTFPAGIATPGPYNIDVRQQAGGSPAQSDPNVAGGTFTWGGTAETSSATARVATNTDKAGYGLAAGQTVASVSGAVGSVTATVTTDVDSAVTAIKTQTDKLLFDGSSNVKSTPQTTVSLNLAQTIVGAHTLAEALTNALTGEGTTVIVNDPIGKQLKVYSDPIGTATPSNLVATVPYTTDAGDNVTRRG